jgi:phosphoheptose isomerase
MTDGERSFLDDYFGLLRAATNLDDDLADQIAKTRAMWLASRDSGGRVLFIGNGGSAGTASHLAIDLSKNGGVPALAFNDAATITCLANDYGYADWLKHAIRIQGQATDTLVAISASGRSPNILNAVEQAKSMGMGLVTLSAMADDNPLRALGDVNFWLDSRAYNIIETVHQFWMMSAIDLIIGEAEYVADRVNEVRREGP